jgi:precorrin-4 methylase
MSHPILYSLGSWEYWNKRPANVHIQAQLFDPRIMGGRITSVENHVKAETIKRPAIITGGRNQEMKR